MNWKPHPYPDPDFHFSETLLDAPPGTEINHHIVRIFHEEMHALELVTEMPQELHLRTVVTFQSPKHDRDTLARALIDNLQTLSTPPPWTSNSQSSSP